MFIIISLFSMVHLAMLSISSFSKVCETSNARMVKELFGKDLKRSSNDLISGMH